MSNNWQSPPQYNQGAENNNMPRPGSLLREYRQQQANQFSPISSPDRNPISPLPPGPYSSPPAGQSPQQRFQGMLANSMQVMRRLSGKVAAISSRMAAI